jgi:N-acetyl sugar amidotransferase
MPSSVWLGGTDPGTAIPDPDLVARPGASPALRRCSFCVMDDSDPDITFDAAGQCHYCRAGMARSAAEGFGASNAPERLAQIVARIREEGRGKPYDCLIGLSGGADSSFLAYETRRLGLRPLAIHLDNGWNTELSVANIEKLVRGLDLDLVTYVVEWEDIKSLQRSFIRAGVKGIEAITDHAVLVSMLAEASRRGIRYILPGVNQATESIWPPSWGPFVHDAKNTLAIHRGFGDGRKLRNYPYALPHQLAYYVLVRRVRWIPVLNYMRYVKGDAMALLEREVGWQPYKNKHGESTFTRFFQEYYLPTKFGIDKRTAHLSSLICSGQLDREAALARLREPLYEPLELELELEYVAKKLGFASTELAALIRAPAREHHEFPNNQWLFKPGRRLTMLRALARLGMKR